MPSTHVCLHHHIVFSTKNREPLIDQRWRNDLHAFIGGCLKRIDVVPLKIGGVSDHVHILAGLRATHSVASILCEIKKVSSLWICETSAPGFHWQAGYGAFAVSRDRVPRVTAYIDHQEAHHKTRTFQEEYVDFLRVNGIEYDERFLW